MSNKVDIKRGSTTIAVGEGLEYHGEWMQHGYVTVTVKSAVKVEFAVGDYVEYCGRRYYLWNAESVKKQARSGSYGEAFVYENMKLYEATVAMEQISMHDYVLGVGGGNGEAYTSLGRFSFYGASVEDLADRIQANLLRQTPAIGSTTLAFRIFTPNFDRCVQRLGVDSQDYQEFRQEWEAYYTGNEESGNTDVTVSIQDETAWGALGRVYNDFNLPYYVNGLDIIVGGKSVNAGGAFAYGKGNGLHSIERNADQEQRIVTRLFAYGSSENLPLNYYGNMHKLPYADGLSASTFVLESVTFYYVDTLIPMTSVAAAIGWKMGTVPYDTRTQHFHTGLPVSVTLSTDSADTPSYASFCIYELNGEQYLSLNVMREISVAITSESKLYLHNGVDINRWPSSKIADVTDYPAGMAIQNLMLPGFPTMSLYDYAMNDGPGTYMWSLPNSDTVRAAWRERRQRYTFSTDKASPWIQSAKASVYGIREGEAYFDGSDDHEEVKPTIENTDYCFIIGAGGIADNGWVGEGGTFTIEVRDSGSHFWESVWKTRVSDDMEMAITSGYHNGRSFKATKLTMSTTTGNAVFTCNRIQDESGRWIPNTEQPISNGNTFTAIGIQLPKEYVDAASKKLFELALDELDRIDHGTYTYLPHIDEIYMAKEQAAAIEGGLVPLHDKIRPGMVMSWTDADLGDVSSVIDSLTIKEDGNNGIPTYDVVLRDEKEKTLVEKISTVVSKSSSVGMGAGQSASVSGSSGYADRAGRLSGDDAHTAWGQTYWEDGVPQDVDGDMTVHGGISIGDSGKGISEDGDATLGDVGADKVTVSETVEGETIETIIEPDKVTTPEVVTPVVGTEVFDGALIGGSGWRIWLEESGASHMVVDQLEVRLKAYFAELEIRKVSHAGGNLIFSAAASRIDEVVPVARSGGAAAEGDTVVGYKCFFKSDDGTTATSNGWVVGDQALCRTFNIDAGKHSEVSNRYYWRKVIAVGDVNASEEDEGEKRSYFVLAANKTGNYMGTAYTNGIETGVVDIPAVGDSVVLLGNQIAANASRQNAIAIESNSTTAPAIYKYQGIDDFSLDGKMVQADFYDSDSHAYKSVTYGDWFVGANTKISNNQRVPVSDPFSDTPETFVRYRQNVSGSPLLEIKAKIDASSTVGNSVIASQQDVADSIDDVTDLLQGYTNTKVAAITPASLGLKYLADALNNAQQDQTIINGGLLLTSAIALKDGNDVTAGINGKSSESDIAAWFGGNPFVSGSIPKIVFNFDGSGYLAGGNISWEDDGDTEVKGTIRADNFFHKVCVFREGGTYFNGKSFGQILTTGDADIVYLVPATINAAWQRSYTDERAAQEASARTIKLPPPSEYPGKTVEFFIFSYGDDDNPQSSGIGYEKEIIIQAYGQAGIVGTIRYDADNDQIVAGSVTNTITVRPKLRYVRFQSMEMNVEGSNVLRYAWIFSTGYGEGGGITMINPTIADGAAEEWVLTQISNWFAHPNGDENQGDDEVARMSDLESLPAQSYSDRVVNLNADLLDGHHASDFVTPNDLQPYALTSALADYVTKNTAQTITAEKTFNANVWLGSGNALKSYDANTDLLAYKSGNWGGVTGEHWFVGAAGVNGFIRSASPLKRWANNSDQYTIWDSSNLTPANFLTKAVADGYYPSLSDFETLENEVVSNVGFNNDTNRVTAEWLNWGQSSVTPPLKRLYRDQQSGISQGWHEVARVVNYGSFLFSVGGGWSNRASTLATFYVTHHHEVNRLTQIGTSYLGYITKVRLRDIHEELGSNGGCIAVDVYVNYTTTSIVCAEVIPLDSRPTVTMSTFANVAETPSTTVWEKTVENRESGDYLPLDGGTVSGILNVKPQLNILNSNDETKISLFGSSGNIHAANVYIGGTATGNLAATRTWVGEQGYQANVIETVKVYGTALTVSNKAVNIPLATSQVAGVVLVGESDGLKIDENHLVIDTAWLSNHIDVPTKVSDLTNDSGFITSSALSNYWSSNTFKGVKVGNTPYSPQTSGTGAGWIDITDEFSYISYYINGKVSKTGDEMSGNLTMVGGSIYFKRNGAGSINGGIWASTVTPPNHQSAVGCIHISGPVNFDNDGAPPMVNGNYLATQEWANGQYLPLTAGSSKPLTGELYISGSHGIQWNDGEGMLVCRPTAGGWTGVLATQWAVGALTAQGVIRSDTNDLLHYRSNTAYKIWDAYNFNPANYLPLDGYTMNSGAAIRFRGSENNGVYIDKDGIAWHEGSWNASAIDIAYDSVNDVGVATFATTPKVGTSYIATQSWVNNRGFASAQDLYDLGTLVTTGYLPLTAGSSHPLTGNIAYKGTKATYDMITFLDNVGDIYGNGIAIGGGGATIIGGGESAGTMSAHVSGGNEVMYIGNDQGVSIFTNLQSGWANRKEFTFGADGSLTMSGSLVSTNFYLYNSAYNPYLRLVDTYNNNQQTWYIQGYQNKLFLGAGVSASMVVTPSGDVGIGTPSPSYKLHVVGNSFLNGNVSINGLLSPNNITLPETSAVNFGIGGDSYSGALTAVTAGSTIGDITLEASRNLTLKSSSSGKVFVYRGSSQKLEVNSSGLSVTGAVVSSGNITSSGTVKGNTLSGEDIVVSDYFRIYVDKTSTTPANMFFSKYGSWSDSGSSQYNFDGNIRANNLSSGSDIRMKDIVSYMLPSVRDIASAPIIEFKWKGNNELNLGSIAQYWEKVFPQAVHADGSGMLAMEYGNIALASAITAARHSLDNERRIAELELRVAELESIIENYEINNNNINN